MKDNSLAGTNKTDRTAKSAVKRKKIMLQRECAESVKADVTYDWFRFE